MMMMMRAHEAAAAVRGGHCRRALLLRMACGSNSAQEGERVAHAQSFTSSSSSSSSAPPSSSSVPLQASSALPRGVEEQGDSAEELEVKPRMTPTSWRPWVVEERGMQVLHEPWLNKGTGFTQPERERLGLRGLLPPRGVSMDVQVARFLEEFRRQETDLRKWRMLQALQDRNETLFYKIIMENITECAPIIYTPTVGQACLDYSSLFRRPRGMFFSAEDQGEMAGMTFNWPYSRVGVVVVTDGSRVLGLGDLGVQGMGICVGKLDLYVAGAGIHPTSVLPCTIDVGTNNERLLRDPRYLGLQRPRLEGEEYEAIVDEFMHAIHRRWPKAIIQFEDFQSKWAKRLLDKYRDKYLCFNDDIQGTAAVVLAGVYGALRVMGLPATAITEQRFVVCGAGSAAAGVIEGIVNGMMSHGMSKEDACRNFYVLDKDGLLGQGREMAELPEEVRSLVRSDMPDGLDLLEVITRAKPTGLFGLSTVGGLFRPEHLRAMAEAAEGDSSRRPMIFALSNPTSAAECSSEDVATHVGGRAIFSSGSPFPDVSLQDGSTLVANQGNNFYVFGGIGLGSLLSGSRCVSDGMLARAAESLPEMLSPEDLAKGKIYPSIEDIREISVTVAAAVIGAAVDEKVASISIVYDLKRLDDESNSLDQTRMKDFIRSKMFDPAYRPLVYSKSKPQAQRAFKHKRELYEPRAQNL